MWRIRCAIFNRSSCKYAVAKCFSRNSASYQFNKFKKPDLGPPQPKPLIGPFGWFLLLIPTSAFGLGTWQVFRKQWKENLIEMLKNRTETKPQPLPKDLSELDGLEYYPVYVRGRFLHDQELHVGPRSLYVKGDAPTQGLLSAGQNTSNGYIVVTPFKLSDRDVTVLVNRGWVPAKNKDQRTRPQGQVGGEVDLVGVVRLNEKRPNFFPQNRPETNSWFYRDLNKMSEITGADPVFLEATSDCNVQGGPIGGQTRVTLRNEHLSYIFTWYSLSAFTGMMWYRMCIKGLPLL